MHYELLYPSKYLKASDLRGKEVKLTIRLVQVEELTMVGGRKENKPVVYFEQTYKKATSPDDEKRMVMNKTNARAIAKMHGNETDGWIGKDVTLLPAMVSFGGGTVEAIRVKGGK